METTFHFSSADEIPEWQKQKVLLRQQQAKDHPEFLIDFDSMIIELEKEFR